MATSLQGPVSLIAHCYTNWESYVSVRYVACSPNCNSCTGQGPGKCDTCNEGYYITTQYVCTGQISFILTDLLYSFSNIQPCTSATEVIRGQRYSDKNCTKTPIRHYLSFYCAVCACTCQVNVSSWQFGVAYCALLCAVCIYGCLFYILFIGCVLSCQFYNKIEIEIEMLTCHH